MTILTSLYRLGQVSDALNTKQEVAERIEQLKKSAAKVVLSEKVSVCDLRKVALFDNCMKRRINAINKLNDEYTLKAIAKDDKNMHVRRAAEDRIQNI